VVTGRINHFISAFGEHVIGEEVEAALSLSANEMGIKVTEFTVAPFISSGDQKSFHEWFIEFEKIPFDLDQFASLINTHLQQKNIYYNDLIKGNILQPLKNFACSKKWV
jgi:hypothetical protein